MQVIAFKLAAIALSILIGVVGFAAYRKCRAWSHPAVLFCFFWCAITIIPLIAVPLIPIHPIGMTYLFAAAGLFSLPVWLRNWDEPVAIAKSRRSGGWQPSDRLFITFVTLQVSTLALMMVTLSTQELTLADFIANPIRTANKFITARYTGAIVTSPLSQLSVVLNYIGAALAGVVVTSRLRWRNAFIWILAFSPSLVQILIYSDKGTLFLCIAYFFGGVLTTRVRNGNVALLTGATTKLSLVLVALIVPIVIFAMLSRGGGTWSQAELAGKLTFYLMSYAFAHVYAFSDWFSHYALGQSLMGYTDPSGLTFGYWTFMPIGRIIWPEYNLPMGYFSEFYTYEGIIKSNIFTMFRGLIYDFGIVGSLIFMFLFGLVSSGAYRMMLFGRRLPIAIGFYIFLAGYIYTSYIISLTIWTSVYAAGAGVCLVIAADVLLASSRWSGTPVKANDNA